MAIFRSPAVNDAWYISPSPSEQANTIAAVRRTDRHVLGDIPIFCVAGAEPIHALSLEGRAGWTGRVAGAVAQRAVIGDLGGVRVGHGV